MLLQDENNFGCKLRNKLYELLRNKVLTFEQLAERVTTRKINIPNEYFPHIAVMYAHKEYDRYRDPIETLLYDYVVQYCVIAIIDEYVGS